jgi:hypothetical protein
MAVMAGYVYVGTPRGSLEEALNDIKGYINKTDSGSAGVIKDTHVMLCGGYYQGGIIHA